MTWYADAPQGNESAKIKYDIVPYTRGRGLDLGCGPFKTYPHFIGVDNGHHAEEFGWQFKPDVSIPDCVDLSLFSSESMDFVFSSHLLEHIEDYKAALAEWWRVIRPGGHLVLYLPHKGLYPNIGQPGSNPDHKHDFMPDDIIDAMEEHDGWDLLIEEDRADGIEYSFFQVYRKTGQPGKDFSCYQRPAKTACVCRFGGFGDMLQAAALFPAMKKAGYHVTVMTTPKGRDILKCDPNIDDWIIQDNEQVPNAELGEYWKVQAKRFDKFVQLSESVEGTLLAMPGRANHAWSAELRSKYLNRNYLEFTFELAGMEYDPDPHFYPTFEEDFEVGSSEIFADENRFIIMWALAGSSMHKFYPHQDAVIAQVMLGMPEAVVVFVGDDACQLLEQGWENEPRVYRMSGKMAIRETLAMARRVDCVVGPETGVLNAVGFEEDVAKVCMLSHSSKENLTRDWKNAIAISAPYDPSVPICHNIACHRLHYSNEFCPTDERTGAAACAMSISPDTVYAAIEVAYEAWKNR